MCNLSVYMRKYSKNYMNIGIKHRVVWNGNFLKLIIKNLIRGMSD